jgi:hypothetical protein
MVVQYPFVAGCVFITSSQERVQGVQTLSILGIFLRSALHDVRIWASIRDVQVIGNHERLAVHQK